MSSTSASTSAAGLPEGTTVQDATANFASDPNMHRELETGRWLYENPETGEEYEWNTAANAWMAVMSEEERKAQQQAYSVNGVDESAPTNVVLAKDRRKKRKADGEDDPVKAKKAPKPKPPPRNTAVYVQGLPQDATPEELSTVFSKAGLILLGADGKPKIKLYDDASTGQRNGEGLVVYMNEESVTLAINLLDDAPLRLGGQDTMKVAKADWGHKAGQENGGASTEQKEPEKKKKKMSNAEAQKMQRRAEKQRQQAQDYDPSYDEKDSGLADVLAASSSNGSGAKAQGSQALGGRVVVLAHVFTLQELEEDASLLLDLKEDVRDECENLGKVTNVVLYDKEPDGIVTIKFSDPISAQACVIKNNNRFFGGRPLKAWIFDGKTRYRKSGGRDEEAGADGEADEKRRLEEFAKWLEEDKE